MPIDKFKQDFAPLRGRYMLLIILFCTPVCRWTFLDAKIFAALRQYQLQTMCTR